jgi:hypothetical protein
VLLQVYRSAVYQDGVDSSGLVEVALEAGERDVHGADVALLGAQRERRQVTDLPHRQPYGSNCVVSAALQGLERDGRRLWNA